VPDPKSERELAFIRDLLIAPDWGERFAELIDQHVKLPEKGRALYLNVGTGGHALALLEKAGHELSLLGLDESNECLDLAQAKTATTKAAIIFKQQTGTWLQLEDDQFDLVLADGSLVATEALPEMISESVRVARSGATIAFSLTTASSFGEFFSIYWEALHNCGLLDHEHDAEELITELPTVTDMEEMARCQGLEEVTSWTQLEEFDYKTGAAFIASPLIADFLMPVWLRSLPEESMDRVIEEVARLIDEERHNADFWLTVKATLVTGRKVDLPLAG